MIMHARMKRGPWCAVNVCTVRGSILINCSADTYCVDYIITITIPAIPTRFKRYIAGSI